MKTFDVALIGAGPAGSTAAIRLASLGLSVALVEKAPFPRRKVCGEFISATTWPLLDALGVGAQLASVAGPPVQRVALYAGERCVVAAMPRPAKGEPWGRALGRDLLDTALRDRARDAGATLFQPWRVVSRSRDGDGQRLVIAAAEDRLELRAREVIAAHGSWEPQPWQSPRRKKASDLLGFKARFRDGALPVGEMPLVLFPGAYGGMVATDGGHVSFSCCVRRDALRAIRAQYPGVGAGEAVVAHAMATCRGIRHALGGARLEASWLSAGPIRPGIATLAADGVLHAGNAAGEAHPLVAEGISMAIQAGWLAAEALACGGGPGAYARAWRAQFATRIHASSLFAALMLRPWGPAACAAALDLAPALLTWGARWSGKAHTLRAAAPAA